MNSKQLAELPRHARKVVREADKSGALDRGEFTMSVARQAVCDSMGLAQDACDDKATKNAIKEAVKEALDNLEGGADVSDGAADAEGHGGVEKDAAPKSKGRSSTSSLSPPASSSDARPRKRKSSKPIKAAVSSKSAETIDDSDDESAGPSKKRKTSSPPASATPGDDSDLSSVYDEPPTKRRASSKGSASSKGKSKGTKKAKDPNEGLSPDEARVADLKRIVVACGVRKQWSKEFADAPTAKSQISHLLGLLQSLGMKGNPTLGKAKSLRERRELAQELDDVTAFEAERGMTSERPRRGRRSTRAADPDEEDEQESAAPPEDGAMAAVMDFLGDDSD